MATITIRNIEDDVKLNLRLRAALNGHSMEEEARAILREVLAASPFAALAEAAIPDPQ